MDKADESERFFIKAFPTTENVLPYGKKYVYIRNVAMIVSLAIVLYSYLK
jgi:hypothetical protein